MIKFLIFLLGLALIAGAFLLEPLADYLFYIVGGGVFLIIIALWLWRRSKKKDREFQQRGAVDSRREALRHTIPRPAMTDKEIDRAGRKLQEKRLRKERVFREGGAGQWTLPGKFRKAS
jgi:hypothetical protein